MKKIYLLLCLIGIATSLFAQKDTTLKKKDRKRDVLLQTSMGGYGCAAVRLYPFAPG